MINIPAYLKEALMSLIKGLNHNNKVIGALNTVYNTDNIMKIRNQGWMTKNLDITDERLGKDHWKNPNTGEVYYTWDAAIRISKKVPGFHLPTVKEWNQLAEACGGVCRNPIENNPEFRVYDNIQELKNKLGIKLTGNYWGSFLFVGSYVDFWTSTEYSSSTAYFWSFDTGSSVSSYPSTKNYGRSVRLVENS